MKFQTKCHIKLSPERRQELANKQEPSAVVVSCSDSRVPPELIFNQNSGDMFVVRTAGQVIDATALGSIEFAITVLHVPLIIVLGHGNCGAVEATLKALDSGEKFDNHIQHIVNKIKPSLSKLKSFKGEKALDEAVNANIHYVVKKLSRSKPVISTYIKEKKVEVVGFRYDIGSGEICLVGN